MKLILKYLKGIVHVGLVFDKTCGFDGCVVGFVDPRYAGNYDKSRSLIGYVFTLTSCEVS